MPGDAPRNALGFNFAVSQSAAGPVVFVPASFASGVIVLTAASWPGGRRTTTRMLSERTAQRDDGAVVTKRIYIEEKKYLLGARTLAWAVDEETAPHDQKTTRWCWPIDPETSQPLLFPRDYKTLLLWLLGYRVFAEQRRGLARLMVVPALASRFLIMLLTGRRQAMYDRIAGPVIAAKI